MTNVDMLQEKIKQSGYTPNELASAWGVSLPTYYKLKAGESEFTASMITTATILLGLTMDEREAIFFAS